MGRMGIHEIPPLLWVNMSHTLNEWLESRVNRATFAALASVTVFHHAQSSKACTPDEISSILGYALSSDLIYVLRIRRIVAAVFVSENKSLLIKYSPTEERATFELVNLEVVSEGQTNSIFESMINKGTIDKYYHVETEEYTVMNEVMNQAINGEDDDYDMDDGYDSDDHDNDNDYICRESWAETHPNPYGTIDCGDGYLDSDGVFTEY